MAVLLALLTTMSISAGEFFAAGVTRRTRAHEVTSSMFASGVVLTSVVALLWPGEPTRTDLLVGALSGVANGTAVLLLYLAYSRGSLRSAAPAAAVVMSSVPIVWDVVVTGTSPSFITWIGIILGVSAIALTTYEGGGGQDEQPILMIAVAAGVIFGVMLILLGEVGEDAGGRPIFFQRVVGFLVAAIATRATGPRIFPGDKAVRARSFVVGLFATSAVLLFVLALQAGGSLAVVSVIGSQYAAVAVLLGVVFGGQSMRWWQGLGLLGTSVAVALITIG
ncbi:MAG: DMT family transporter [Acidimicrobiia bacterium]|nr:DMT family transporter [Acidimicrobiia bacterium]